MANMIAGLRALAKSLVTDLPSGVQPEDQLKSPIKVILESLGSRVEVFTEAKIDFGRPDMVIRVAGAICGYVELKEPGKSADPNRLKGPDKLQWKRFQALPNLIYSNGRDWGLYRSGEVVAKVSGVIDEDGVISDAATAKLHALLENFRQWEPIAPTTPKGLAETLAPLCRMLRDDVAEVLENESSTLNALSKEIRQALFPNASHRDFADTYAQTLTYALLLARLLGEQKLTTESAAKRLESGHKLLASVLQHMALPDARREVATAVDVLERVVAAVVPERLARKGDPWVYFYEDFLEAYDPKLRKDRGVYYTPVEVIRCQVKLGDELLRSRFGKDKGYADEGVVFLDPAAGTAAYPLAMVEHSLAEVESLWGKGMVDAAASELARNTHAFEILVGPYAVAHLRISEAIRARGGEIPEEGLPVYLTDTLESPNAAAPSGGVFSKTLTEEHKRAIRIKRDSHVLVCMGNPPYDREQAENPADPTPTAERKGGWVRFGDRDAQKGHADKKSEKKGGSQASEDAADEGILRDFLNPAKDAGMGGHLKNLYNDYVYFWRWALWKLFENPRAQGPGIVSFITASSYLRGPGFVGMRKKMREAFDDLWIIDLGGDNLGARKTPNVFNIQTPVAIAIGVRYGEPRPDVPARVHYSRVDAETREEKLSKVGAIGAFSDLCWQVAFDGWMQPFLPVGQGAYFDWPRLTDIFPWQHSGAQFKRSWPIGETESVVVARWQKLVGSDAGQRAELFRESRDRKVDKRYPELLAGQVQTPIAMALADAPHPFVRRYAFRSFDRQWCLADGRLGDYLRADLWETVSDKQIFLTSLLSGVLGLGAAAVVSSAVPDLHHFRGSFGGKDVVPLWRNAEATQPNVTSGLLDLLSKEYGNPVSAEDLFAYAYAIMATPRYVEHFSEELTIPGPRLPLTSDASLFSEAVEVGRKLIYWHTFGDRLVPAGASAGSVPKGVALLDKAIPGTTESYPKEFAYDPAKCELYVGSGVIVNVSPEVFGFSISGLEVVKSWLAYRMQKGAGKKSSPLDEVRPERWSQAMSQELLQLLWVLEFTLAEYPRLDDILIRILSNPLIPAAELPQPDESQRKAPGRDEPDDTSQQGTLRL